MAHNLFSYLRSVINYLMMRRIIVLPIVALFLLFSCNSSQKSYQSGTYDAAVLKAVKKLRKNGENKKAIDALSQAYPAAKGWHEGRIAQFKSSGDVYKWEKVMSEYKAMNRQYDEINRCPACLNFVQAVRYTAEYDGAVEKAAEVRYALA